MSLNSAPHYNSLPIPSSGLAPRQGLEMIRTPQNDLREREARLRTKEALDSDRSALQQYKSEVSKAGTKKESLERQLLETEASRKQRDEETVQVINC
eukprot:9151100-Pyramimonas_sp.AAC.2